jgi:L-ascorbate metabolism protein UlaG (beta-lactamase superfamily)
MRLTKYGHACVRIEDDGRVLVIDPGVYSEPEALSGATAVLVTHEHEDHADLEQLERAVLTNPALTVHGPASWADSARDRLGNHVVGLSTGDAFSAAGFEVTAVGGKHAEIIDGLPDCANLGYVVDGGVYHPGDSYFVPTEPVQTLLVPANGPWTKHREAIEFVRALRPSRMFPIHDIGLSALGCANFDAWMGDEVADYARIPVGSSVTF